MNITHTPATRLAATLATVAAVPALGICIAELTPWLSALSMGRPAMIAVLLLLLGWMARAVWGLLADGSAG